MIQLSLFFIVIQFDVPQFDDLHITWNGHGMEHYGNCKYIKVCFSVVEWRGMVVGCHVLPIQSDDTGRPILVEYAKCGR